MCDQGRPGQVEILYFALFLSLMFQEVATCLARGFCAWFSKEAIFLDWMCFLQRMPHIDLLPSKLYTAALQPQAHAERSLTFHLHL